MERYNAEIGELECYNFGSEDSVQTFRPTFEEFQDFEKYIHFMEENGAHKTGIAKVIPPPEWVARKEGYKDLENFSIPSPVEQLLMGSSGAYQLCNVEKKEMTLQKYLNLSNSRRFEPPTQASSYDDIERIYWKNLHCFAPIYGADVPGSLTDTSQTVWNIANLPSSLDCIEKEYGVRIQGVNTPYLYFGMWKTTFPWHTEDADLYSINYLHFGAPKFWYTVPPSAGLRFERVAQGYFQNLRKQCKAFLRHKTTLLSPQLLHNYSIPYNKMLQFPGQFIITFPYAYHAGFNTGFNCAESTNFALPRWIDYGKSCSICDCMPDSVKIDMDCFVRKYQPDRYENWKAGLERSTHPEGAAAGQNHNRICTRIPPLADQSLVASRSMCSKRQARPRARKPKTLPDKATSQEDETLSKKQRVEDGCGDFPETEDSKRSNTPDNDRRANLANGCFTSLNAGSSLTTANIAPSSSHSFNQEHHGQSTDLISPGQVDAMAVNERKPLAFHKGNDLQNPECAGSITEKCSCGRCYFDPCLFDGCPLQFTEAVSHLHLRSSMSDFSSEKSFNHFMSLRAPHCAICQLCVADNPAVCGPCPPSSVPLITELPFAIKTVNRMRNMADCASESRLLHCSSCLLTIHEFCYGATDYEGPSYLWTCDRCQSKKFDAHCSLCILRGGALKSTSNGNWAHVICALFGCGAAFESDLTRSPILEPATEVLNGKKCRICSRSDGAMARCTAGNCQFHCHVTCGAFLGALLVVADWPEPSCLLCPLRHGSRRNTLLTGRTAPCPDVGEKVFYILPKLKCNLLKDRLVFAEVIGRKDATRLHLRFEGNGSACDDFHPKNVIDPPRGTMPQVGTWITVRWDDGTPYRAFCLDVISCYKFDLLLCDGSIVKKALLGDMIPFIFGNFDFHYFG